MAIIKRGKFYHLKRRVPRRFAELEPRAFVYRSLHTDSEQEAREKETHLFLSHAIHCSCAEGGTGCDGAGPRGKYRGLSTKIADHQHSWIPQSEWMTIEDRPLLINLEQWFSDNCLEIAKRCLSLVGSDPVVSAYAIEGFASAHGGSGVAWSTQMFANGEDVSLISREMGAYNDCDNIAVAKLFPYIYEKNPDLALFMLDYPGCSFVPDDP